jgi:predicted nucleic acid-binding protein
MLNLDTHIVIHLLDGALTNSEIQILSGQSVGISAIVIWELAKLH